MSNYEDDSPADVYRCRLCDRETTARAGSLNAVAEYCEPCRAAAEAAGDPATAARALALLALAAGLVLGYVLASVAR